VGVEERAMTFVFWGLFVVLGLIALGYWWWMLWVEKEEREDES
jgi:cbb3-type cytochrome oxidase subunit 3